MRYRPEIDGLRALAVLAVAFFHISLPVFSGGYVGVDVFFVISGFLITSIIYKDFSNKNFSVINFWERRIRRILPALSVVIFFTLLFGLFFLVPNHFLDLGQSIGTQSLFITNYMFWRESGYFDNPAQFKPLLHTWSLSVEEQFYVLLPIIFFVSKKFNKKIFRSLILSLLILSFLLSVFYLENHKNSVFYFLPFRAWELLLGSCLAMNYIPTKKLNKYVVELVAFISIIIILLCFIIYDQSTEFPGIFALPVCLGTAVFIWVNSSNYSKLVNIIFTNKVTVFIGKLSYSFYLIHWPVLIFGSYIALRPLTIIESLFLLLLSMILSFFSWKYIEQPIRQKRILKSKRSIYIYAIFTLFIFFIIGILIHINNGFPNRFNNQVNLLANGNIDNNPRRLECHYISNKDIHLGNLCERNVRLEDPKQPSFISWGDSHADAIMPLLEEIALENDLAMYHASKNSCPPLINTIPINSSKECYEFNNYMLKNISDKGIKNVILTARWLVYTKGRSDIEPLNETSPLLVTYGSNNKYINPERAIKNLEKHLNETIDIINSLDATVWIIEQPPEQQLLSPPDQLAQYSIRGRDISNLGVERSVHQNRENYVSEIMHSIAKTNQRVHIISPDVVLCDEKKCNLEYKGISIYRDDDHLTVSGSKILKPLFNHIIMKNLTRN